MRVKLEGCGVGAGSARLWEGKPWQQYPLAPGAPGCEGWGTVDAVGADVRSYRIGDRVGFLSSHAFAHYDLVTPSDAIHLPDGLAGMPFPAAPLGAAVNIFRRSALNKGDCVAVIGVGFIGAILIQLALLCEVKVIAITRRAFGRKLASAMGAAHCIPFVENGEVIERVKALTDNKLCDVVIEATGVASGLDLAGELTRERGRLVIAGYHQDSPRQINMQLWNWRGLDVINAHERDAQVINEEMCEAAAAVDHGLIQPAPLYTHRIPFKRLNEALKITTARPDGFLKVLIDF